MSGIRGAADVAAIKVGGQTELNITLDRSRMARYGLNINDVNATIQTAMGGSAVNVVLSRATACFDVTLRMDRALPRCASMMSPTCRSRCRAGGTLPLGAIADIEVRQGAARVGREAGGRMVAVKANLLGPRPGQFCRRGDGEGRARRSSCRPATP